MDENTFNDEWEYELEDYLESTEENFNIRDVLPEYQYDPTDY